jgi:signal transduction histidine kinase
VLRSFSARDLDLRTKILVVALLPTALLVAAVLAVFATQRGRMIGLVEAGMGAQAQAALSRAARDARTLCEATHQELHAQVPRSLAVMRDQLERLGSLSFSATETVPWRAVNQLDRSVSDVRLPRVLLGGRPLEQNADLSRPTPLVDRVKVLVGAEATLFQRMNEAGDMLRVATTVQDPRQGGRAIGTYIPAVDPEGTPNPVVSTVLRGETYRGRARVVDHWHLSGYEPLRDGAGRIVGMLFVGLRQEALEGIRHGLSGSRFGETGLMYVIGGTGNQRGRWLIPPRGEAAGAEGWDERDAHGDPYVQRLVEAAMTAGEHPVEVRFARRGDSGEVRDRVASAIYFAPWDWVIVAELDREETIAPLRVMQASLAGAFVLVALIGFVLLLATIWAASRGAAYLAAPLGAMAVAAERIAQGDVQQDVTFRSKDEVGRLAEAFRGTIRYLGDVARGADAIARGDLSGELAPRSDRDALTRSFQSARSELRRLVEEMDRLTHAAVEGRLGERAQPERFQGAYREALVGVNATLDTLVGHLDVMPAPAMIIGPDFTIRYTNQTGATLLGHPAADLVGTKCYDAFRMGDCNNAGCASARAMAQRREVSSETDAHPEGLDLHVLYTAVPLRDAAGGVIGAFEVITDQVAVKRSATEPEPPGPGGVRRAG